MAKELQQTYRMIKPKEGERNKGRIKIETPQRNPSTMFNGKSVKKTKNIEDSKSGSYDCFAISFLIDDLFHGNEYAKDYNTSPIINLTTIPKAGKDKLSFFLPKEIFSYIEKKRSSNPSKEDYYGHFFQFKYSDNFISNYIYDYYTEIGWDKFIKKVQTHIVNKFADIDLSSNEELINYLSSVGDDTIVPKLKSPKANSAFSKLIEGGKNGNSENLALIIANFFISCFLGLRSMNCKVESYKMYLLSEFGMECIWRPDLITPPHERIDEVRQMYKRGSYALSYKIGKQWLSEYETRANKEELAIAYQFLGSSLYKLASSNSREYIGKQSEGIEYLEKCIETGKADLSVFYSLYEYLKDDDIEKAIGYLKTAFAQNYAKAVVEVEFLHLNEETRIKDISYEEILAKIEHIISHESENELTDVGKCYYLRGRFARKNGNESMAQKDFETASKKGNERAKRELIRKERNAERNTFPSFSNQPKAKCCFANTLTGTNYQVVSTFPNDEWALFAPVKTTVNGIQFARNIDEFISLQHIGEFEFCRPKIVFLFMSDDKEKNLNDCLELLDKLFNTVFEIPDKQKWELIDNTYIYVNANYETASMLIDANMSQMGNDIYFKVHIADENRDTVHKLLCDAPLFLPALNGAKSESATKVVLFGSSETNYCFVKESIASAYLGVIHPIEITLLGENADVLESRFKQECSGVFGCPDITCIRPKFIKCSIKETDFPRLISGQSQITPSATEAAKEEPDNDIAETLKEGNYFIVDYADDLENIRFAMELRTWLLRSRDTFDRTPFIGVKVSNKQNSYLTSHLTLAGQAAGNSYYNKYDLFPFGISALTYHYRNMIEDPVLNRIALQIHKFYYLDNDLDKSNEENLKEALEECKRSSENDFYSYSYNADSSTSTAIGLCYRFFAAKCIPASKEDYLDFGALKDQDLISRFSDQLNSESIEELAKIEQSRWNSYMLIRGWLPANEAQVNKYEKQSSGIAHKHILAKLHPFINEWDNLDDSNLVKLLAVFKLKANYNKKPQVTTIRSIEDTTRFLKTEDKENEQTH